MKKLTKKQKKISCLGVIIMGIVSMAISLGILFRNLSWMNGAFFMFGMMFFMGYALLILTIKKIRGVRVNA